MGPGSERRDVGYAAAAVRWGLAAEYRGHRRADRERHRYEGESGAQGSGGTGGGTGSFGLVSGDTCLA